MVSSALQSTQNTRYSSGGHTVPKKEASAVIDDPGVHITSAVKQEGNPKPPNVAWVDWADSAWRIKLLAIGSFTWNKFSTSYSQNIEIVGEEPCWSIKLWKSLLEHSSRLTDFIQRH